MAMLAMKKMTGNKKAVMLAAFHNLLCERTGGGRIWGRTMTLTRAAAWASAAISGLGLCGGVRSPTIFEEAVTITLAGGRCGGKKWWAPTRCVSASTACCATSPRKLPTFSMSFEARTFLAFNCLPCLRIVVDWTYTLCFGRWRSRAC